MSATLTTTEFTDADQDEIHGRRFIEDVREEELPFTPQEVRELEADDDKAGTQIGKILSGLFVYTAIVMSIAALWTYRAID